MNLPFFVRDAANKMAQDKQGKAAVDANVQDADVHDGLDPEFAHDEYDGDG